MYKEYIKVNKYIIKYKNPKFNINNYFNNDIIPDIWEKEYINNYSNINKTKYIIIGPFTERNLFTKYNINILEVMEYMGKEHYYINCRITQPLIIEYYKKRN
jgi:hypothetical protein